MSINYMKDYYQILGVASDASYTEIKYTYKKLALKLHPDKNPIKDKREAELQFIELQEAYDVLKNDETRQDYNNNYQNPSFALFRSFVTQKSISIAEVLSYLNKGASIDAHNAFNQSILMYASNRANFDMVEFLVKNNASINAVDGAGNTPLMYTAIKKSVHFSVDNAEIIKERNQQYFNDSADDQPQSHEESPEKVEEELDVTKPPVIHVSFKLPDQKSFWESTKLAISISGTIYMIERSFFDLAPRYQYLLHAGILSFVYQEFVMELGKFITSSVYNYFSGYEVKFGMDQEAKQEDKPNNESDIKIDQDKAKVAQFLIDHNASIAQENHYGKSALDYATDYHNVPLMNIFYKLFGMEDKIIPEENITDVNTIINSSALVLGESIIDISRAGYIKKLNREITPVNNNVIIDLAKNNGHTEAVEILTEYMEAECKAISTSLYEAVRQENIAVIKKLVTICKEDVNNSVLFLYVAAKSKNLAFIRLLVELGSDVNWGQILLYYAAEHGNVEAIKLLVELGADVNKDYYNPLYCAIHYGTLEAIQLLVELGADINKVNNDGETPLHMAARDGEVEAIRLLVELGADINKADERGNTPLNDVMIWPRGDCKKLEVLKLLVELGADINKVNNHGYTPLHGAASWYDNWCVENAEVMRLLVAFGANVEAIDNYGRTPLHYAAINGHEESIRVLVGLGADINKVDIVGMTVLHDSAMHRRAEYIRLLVELGADINKVDIFGRTPLHYAAEHGNVEAIKLLVELGADVNQADKRGKTPLNLAKDKYALDYATDYHNVPLMNIFYKLFGMEDKIIPEENITDVNTTINSSALVLGESIIDISKAGSALVTSESISDVDGHEVVAQSNHQCVNSNVIDRSLEILKSSNWYTEEELPEYIINLDPSRIAMRGYLDPSRITMPDCLDPSRITMPDDWVNRQDLKTLQDFFRIYYDLDYNSIYHDLDHNLHHTNLLEELTQSFGFLDPDDQNEVELTTESASVAVNDCDNLEADISTGLLGTSGILSTAIGNSVLTSIGLLGTTAAVPASLAVAVNNIDAVISDESVGTVDEAVGTVYEVDSMGGLNYDAVL